MIYSVWIKLYWKLPEIDKKYQFRVPSVMTFRFQFSFGSRNLRTFGSSVSARIDQVLLPAACEYCIVSREQAMKYRFLQKY